MTTLYTRIATAVLFCCCVCSLSGQTAVVVDAPASTAGTYLASPAAFGPAANGENGAIVAPVNACTAITDDLTGNLAIVDFDADLCDPSVQALNVQAAGAIGMIICQDLADDPFVFLADAPTVTIPVVALGSVACTAIRMDLTGSSATLNGPLDGFSCQTAITITDGTYTAPALDQGLASVFAGAIDGLWYKYTVPQDGVMNVNACGGGADTRLFVIPGGDCNEVSASIASGDVSFNDDACDLGDGDEFASEVNAFVSAGDEFHILWDDRWSSSGFDFSVGTSDTPDLPVTFSVDVSNEDLAGQAVQVDGNFTDTPIDLMDQGNGIYATTVNIEGGTDVTYNFFIGGTAEPTDALAGCSIDDGSGNVVRSLTVGLDTVQLDLVCFGACTPCTIIVDDCADPFILIDEDYSGIPLGTDVSTLFDFWDAWDANSGSGVADTIGDEPAVLISENVAGLDAIFTTGLQESGHFIVQFDLFVPGGNAAYYNLQHRDPMGVGAFANQVFFDTDGTAFVDLFGLAPDIEFTYPQDEFFRIHTIIDIDAVEARMFVDGSYIGGWDWSIGSFQQAASDFTEFYGINFFPIGGDADDYTFYVDNTLVRQIPPSADNLYCYTAEAVTPGTYTTPTLECFGGVVFIEGSASNDASISGAWYSYTPDADGRITVGACESGRDSRVWIYEGDCRTPSLVGVNDDQCGDDTFASLREAFVTAGTTYYILWDGLWDTNPTEWTLEFTTDAGEPGNFCQTAIDVQPGIFSFDNLSDLDGNAAVAGKLIPTAFRYSGGSTPAAYSQTEWYQYTPTADGEITITACDLTTEDTRFFVYTGSCENFDSLTVVTADDDGCGTGGGPSVVTFNGVAGTTYYIEWDNAFLDNGFLWELQGAEPETVDVTFAVDVSLEDMPADTAFVIGSFVGWADPIALEDQGDGLFVGTVAIPANDTFAFKFQNGRGNFEGGDFLEDCGISGGFGFDRLLITGDEDMTMDTVCFRYCVDCQTVDTQDPVFSNAFSVQPNPATDLVELFYNLPDTRQLRLTLTNTLGQTVRTESLGRVSAGQRRLDVSELSSGLYHLVITDGTYTHSEKLVKQ